LNHLLRSIGAQRFCSPSRGRFVEMWPTVPGIDRMDEARSGAPIRVRRADYRARAIEMIWHWNRAITAGAALCIAVVAPGNAQQRPDSIAAFYQAWSAATASEGPAGYARFFAPAARLIPPGAAPVVGRDSIRGWVERSQREATTHTEVDTIVQDDITIAGSYALVVTIMRGQRIPKDGGAPVPFETRYVDVLERTPTGWQFTYRTWSDSPRTP
jgi:ketosteroid isomerase-like protein